MMHAAEGSNNIIERKTISNKRDDTYTSMEQVESRKRKTVDEYYETLKATRLGNACCDKMTRSSGVAERRKHETIKIGRDMKQKQTQRERGEESRS
jgi:hypothetical protein